MAVSVEEDTTSIQYKLIQTNSVTSCFIISVSLCISFSSHVWVHISHTPPKSFFYLSIPLIRTDCWCPIHNRQSTHFSNSQHSTSTASLSPLTEGLKWNRAKKLEPPENMNLLARWFDRWFNFIPRVLQPHTYTVGMLELLKKLGNEEK